MDGGRGRSARCCEKAVVVENKSATVKNAKVFIFDPFATGQHF
jgi:hypothetical protein